MKKTSLIAIAMTATLALGACATEDEPENNNNTAAEENNAAENNGAENNTADDGADNGVDETGDDAADTGDDADTTDEAGDAGAGDYSDPSCQEFFTEGGPLADRADTIRTALDNGEIADQVTYSELSLLKQRIDQTSRSAEGDVATLLDEVNAPFAEVVDLVNETDALDAESGELTLPEIDTQASADAQAELETVCAG